MLVLEGQRVGEDLSIEIRTRWPVAPPFLDDLRRLDVCGVERSRVLRLRTDGRELSPEQLQALVDPLTEEVVDAFQGGRSRTGENGPGTRRSGCRSSTDERDGRSAAPMVVRPQRTRTDEGDGTFDAPMIVGPLRAATGGGDGVDVFCRPGVTDAEGETASLALAHAGAPGVVCRAGVRYRFDGRVPGRLRPAVERLLGNALIQQFTWHDAPEMALPNGPVPVPEPAECVEVRNAGDDELRAISRRFSLALDLDEMRAIRQHFTSLGRAPTDVELQSIALTWSEHCSHKTFKATVEMDHDGTRSVIHGLLDECFVAPTASLDRAFVRSAFADNAGVIAFDRDLDLAIKVETHNHPSALEPYGGAHTGVGGVIRDVLAVSAEPIANTDVLCFGPLDLPDGALPPGVFHPCRTLREVVRGVADYGNNMGIPTVGGAILHHQGYIANPLVFCGTVGIAPRGGHPREPRPGDVVVLLGGRTGRDGIHGATMSSETLDRGRAPQETQASPIQIGAPITEKLLRDVLPRLRDERLYHAITDCGAGGLCSAVGEMGEPLGVEVDLARVPLKYEGLRPWEIWLSEAQERMVLAVAPASLARLQELCAEHGVEATELGHFRADGRLRLTYADRVVADLAMSFLHGGRPSRVLAARWTERDGVPYRAGDVPDAGGALLALLSHPTIASKEDVVRRYDHEVGARTIVKPLTGNAGPSDATVLRPAASWRGVAIGHGINPLYGELDPHAMALLAVDEALRNLVAAGGSLDHAALLDNFCWGNVDDPDGLGAVVRAAEGCRDAALAYCVPFISGKDSLRNTSVDAAGEHSIPGTLLITAIGVVADARHSVTMNLTAPGNRVYLLGMTADELGGSHYLALAEGGAKRGAGRVPAVDPATSRRLMERLTRAIGEDLVRSCHDLSEGGLAVAAAEMSLAGTLGVEIDLRDVPSTTDALEALLFAESAGRFLIEVAPEDVEAFERLFAGLPCADVGETAAHDRFIIRRSGEMVIDLAIAEIDGAFRGPHRSPTGTDGARGANLEVRDHGPIGSCGSDTSGHQQGESRTRRAVGRVKRPRVMVLAAAGINCDAETAEACRLAGAEAEIVGLRALLGGSRSLGEAAMLVLPGGFSYGDHLGAGAMLATVLRHRLLDELLAFVADGRPVLGICNGFQVLARLGLLGPVSLVANASGRFECRWVRLAVTRPSTLFLDGLQDIELPVAHGEGRIVASAENLPTILDRSPLRYIDNPNGSMAGVAAVGNETGTVLGMMPHPERFTTPYHHPSRRGPGDGEPTGLTIFRNAVRHASRL